MPMQDGDLIAQSRVARNFLDRIEALELRVDLAERRTIYVGALDELSDDLGEIHAGRFISGDIDTDALTGSGVVIDGDDGVTTTDGATAAISAWSAGVTTFYISQEDGKVYAVGGAVVFDVDGIEITGLNYLFDFTATGGSVTRTAHLGMVIGPDGETPAFALLQDGETAGSELVTNGGFETGDFTGWTRSSAAVDLSNPAPHGGSYGAAYGRSFAGSDTLVSDRITAITAGVAYTASCFATKKAISGSATSNYYLKWYDATSGGNLLRTDTILADATIVNAIYPDYVPGVQTVIAPAGALSVEFYCDFSGTFELCLCDDFSLYAAAGSTRQITFQPDPTVSNGGWGYQELASAPTGPLQGYVRTYVDAQGNLRQQRYVGQDDIFHRGGYIASFDETLTTTPVVLVSETIFADALGPNGHLRYVIDFNQRNSSGASRTITVNFNFGSKTVTKTFTISNATGTGISTSRIEFDVWNDASASAQRFRVKHEFTDNTSPGGTAGGSTTTTAFSDTGTEATGSNVTVSIDIASSNNTATQWVNGYIERFGPYQA